MNSIVTPSTLALAYAVMFCVCILTGRAQRRELGASWSRLCFVAALLAAAALSPALPALVMGEKLDKSWFEASALEIPQDAMPDEEHGGYWVPIRGQPEWFFGSGYFGIGVFAPVNMLVVFLALVMAVKVVHVLRPVWRLLGESAELDRVEDLELLDHVAALAKRFGVATPVVFRRRSDGDSLEINAQAVGVLAPVIIVMDGMLDRIDDDETRAILAHEMGHLRRRSTLRYLLIVHAVFLAGPVLSAFLFPSVAIAWLITAAWGLLKIAAHVEEKACDLIEAQTAGFATATKAMNRIHGPMKMDCGPVLERLFYATQTHPSESVRLHHLATHAPADQRADVVYEVREAARQRRVDRDVRVALLLVFAFAIWAGLDARLKWWGVGALVFTLIFPLTIVVLAVFKRLYYSWQLGYLHLPWQKPVWFLAFVFGIFAFIAGFGEPWFWPSFLTFAVGIGALVVRRRRSKHATALEIALKAQDFPGALSLCDALSRRRQRRPAQRVFVASVLAADRRDEEARAVLDTLAADRPRYWPGQILRATVTRWFDVAAGLRIADVIAGRFPRNPIAMAHRASMLLRVGRLDEAEALIRRAIRLFPALGDLYGLLSAVHRIRGDLAASDAQVAEFEARDPGSTLLLVYKARNVLARDVLARSDLGRDDLTAAAAALRVARQAVEANRMSLWMHDMDELEAKYAAVRTHRPTGPSRSYA